jgi:hypothetical protein
MIMGGRRRRKKVLAAKSKALHTILAKITPPPTHTLLS